MASLDRIPRPGRHHPQLCRYLSHLVTSGDKDTNHVYSLLHLTLVDIITSRDSLQLPAKYLSHLTESLVSRLDETRSVSSEQTHTQTALDRFGQIVAAALYDG